jgi:hypothetical protein
MACWQQENMFPNPLETLFNLWSVFGNRAFQKRPCQTMAKSKADRFWKAWLPNTL